MVSDETIVGEIIEEMSDLYEIMGIHKILTKVWLKLYFGEDKTQDELKKELKCGLSSISQAINTLEKFGLICVSGKKGRKNVYSAEKSFNKIKRKKIEAILRFHVEPMANLLNSKMDSVSDKDLKERMKELKNAYSYAGKMMNLFLKMPFVK